MSTPLGEKILAAVPVPLDHHLAAHLDPGYERLKGNQRHRPARWPRHQNAWSNSGASMPCSLTI
jgi:hypothetical protein